MYADKYGEAAKKFREAVARVPEAKYFFNLCTSRLQEGKFDEALTACNAVEQEQPDAGAEDEDPTSWSSGSTKRRRSRTSQLHAGRRRRRRARTPAIRRPTRDRPNDPPQPPPTDATRRRSVAPLGTEPRAWRAAPEHATRGRSASTCSAAAAGSARPTATARHGRRLRLKARHHGRPGGADRREAYFQFTHIGQGATRLALGRDASTSSTSASRCYKHFCLGGTPASASRRSPASTSR